MIERLKSQLGELWRQPSAVGGLELWFDTVLLVLRIFSLAYWLRYPFERRNETARRNCLVDGYCVVEFIVLVTLLVGPLYPFVSSFLCWYFLFEIYLSLFNIVFLGKFAGINYKPPSIERDILLMFLNVLQVVVAFAVLYRTWLGLPKIEALSAAVNVLGTVGLPPVIGNLALLVDLQILLDVILLVIFLASFAGQVRVFQRDETQ
jgi:hypothetical protein